MDKNSFLKNVQSKKADIRDKNEFLKGVRKIKAQNKLQEIDRIMQSYDSELQTFGETYKKRQNFDENQYQPSAGSWLNASKALQSNLNKQWNDVQSILKTYGDVLNQEDVKSISEYFTANQSVVNNIVKSDTSIFDFYSKFKDADDYSSWVDNQNDLNELYTADTEANTKEIEELEKKYGEYVQLEQKKQFWEGQHMPWELENNAEYNGINEQLASYGYDSSADFNQAIADKRAFNKKAVYLQDKKKLKENAIKDPDFEKIAKIGKSKASDSLWSTGGDNEMETFFNNPYGMANDRGLGNSKYFLQMTPQERAIYNFYVGKDGQEKADEFLDTLKEELASRFASTISEEAGDHILKQYALRAGANATMAITDIGNLFKSADEYIPATYAETLDQYVASDIAEKHGEKSVASIVGDLTGTTARMAPSIAISAIPGAGPALGAATMGAGVAGGAYKESVNEGRSWGEAMSYAALTGASETALQYVLGGITTLGGKASGNIVSKGLDKALSGVKSASARVALKNGGKFVGNMVSEFGEEYLQEILTPIYKNIAFGEDNQFDAFTEDALYAGILGALSAGALNGSQSAITTSEKHISNIVAGKDLLKQKNAEARIKRLTELGKTASADSVAYQVANKINEKTGVYTIGKLIREVGCVITEQNVSDIKKSLTRKGVTENDAESISEWFALSVNSGLEFSDMQIQAIEENDVLKDAFTEVILNPNSTVNQRTRKFEEVFEESYKSETAENTPKQFNENKELTESGTSDALQMKLAGVNTDALQISDNGKNIQKSTGKEIEIKKIKSIENGKMAVELTDESTLDSSDIAYSDENQGLLYEGISNLNLSTEASNALIMAYSERAGNMPVGNYLRGALEAVTYGQYGMPIKELAGTYFASEMPNNLQKILYAIGSDYGKQIAQKQKKTADQNRRRSKGKIFFDGVDQSKLTDIQNASVDGLRVLSDALDVEVHLFASKTGKNGRPIGENGRYENGKIYIDIHSGDNGQGVMLFTAAHELVHHIRKNMPDKFKTFADFLFNEYGKAGVSVRELIDNQMEKAKKDGRNIDFDTAYEEVVADSCETFLADGKAVEKLKKLQAKDKGLVKEILNFIRDLVAKIRKAYAGMNPDSAEGKYVAKTKDAADALQSRFEDMLVELAKQNGKAVEKDNKKTSTGDGEVKYSVRKKFFDEYDAWDKKNPRVVFHIGNTSNVLQSIGVKNSEILWDSSKIIKIKADHKEMTDKIIKQVPQILENPIVVFRSLQNTGRLTLFGEVYAGNKPILAVLELNPNGRNGATLNAIKIASAYGKDNAQNLINRSTVLYIDQNTKRVTNWERRTGLQLPVGQTFSNSINSISKNTNSVNAYSTKNSGNKIKKLGRNQLYSYETLISKPDMAITSVDDTIYFENAKEKRKEIVEQSIANAKKVGGTNSAGNAVINVLDIGKEVIISKNAIRHGVDRRLNIVAPVFIKAGEILKNAIVINELLPRDEITAKTYVLIGFANGISGANYPVSFVVNSYTNEVVEMNVLYSAATKKEPAHLNDAGIAEKSDYLTGSVISITDLLNYVNKYFPDILSEDVLKHYGHTERPKGDLGESALFSSRNQSNAALQEENRHLKELLKLQKSLTHGTKFTKDSLDKISRSMMRQFEAKGNVSELSDILQDVYGYIAGGQDVTWEEIVERSQPAIDWLREHENRKQTRDQLADEILHDLRVSRISLDDLQKDEAEYIYGNLREFRNRTMGSVIVTDKNAVSLDVKWQEWAEIYPGYFDPDVNPNDMPSALLETIDFLRNSLVDNEPIPAEGFADYVMDKIYDGYWDASTLRTVADVKQKQIDELKRKHKKTMLEFRDYRKAQKERLKEVKREYQDKIKQRVERIERNTSKETLHRLINETVKWLTHPSKTDVKCPDYLRKPLGKFLSSIDTSSKQQIEKGIPTKVDNKFAESINSLAYAIDRAEATQQEIASSSNGDLLEGYLDLPSDFTQKMRDLAEKIKESTQSQVVYEMTGAEISELCKIIRTLRHAVKEMGRLYNNVQFANVQALGQETIREADARKRHLKDNKMKDFLQWENATPYYAFKWLGKGGQTIFKEMMVGQERFAFLIKDIKDFKKKNWSGKEAREWSNVVWEIVTENGNEIRITPAQAMGIYCLAKREHSLRDTVGSQHLTVSESVVEGYKEYASTKVNFTAGDITNIIGKLTNRQIEVADAIQHFFSTVCSDWGNEISMKRFLQNMFTENFYYPFETNPQSRGVEDPKKSQTDMFRLLNISATKSLTKNANNGLVIRNIFDVFTSHSTDMARLNTFGMPLLDYMKWFNYAEKSEKNGQIMTQSVRRSFENAFGKAANDYIFKFVKDINGTVSDLRENAFLSKMIRGAKTAAVGGNARVAMLQVTALPRALAVLSGKDIAASLARSDQVVKNYKKAKEYCGIVLWKSFGFYDTNISKSIEGQIRGDKNVFQNLVELSMKGAEYGDAYVTGILWGACEREVKRTNEYTNGSEDFIKAVAERLRDVIYQTQVVDSVLTRSQMMRNKSLFTQGLTAFMSEPTLSYNIWLDMKNEWVLHKGKATKYIVKRVVALAITGLCVTLMGRLWNALCDEDDEPFDEKYWDGFSGDLLENLNPIQLPLVQDIFSTIYALIRGESFSDAPLESQYLEKISTVVNDIRNMIEKAEDSSDTGYRLFYDVASAFSSVSGLPVSNYMRDAVSIWNSTAGEVNPKMKVRKKKLSGENLRNLLYETILLGNKERLQELKTEFDTLQKYDNAVVKSLRENDERISQAAQERANGDMDTYSAFVNEIKSEGYFTQDQIVSAVMREYNEITKTNEEPEEWWNEEEEISEDGPIFTTADVNIELESGDYDSAIEMIEGLMAYKIESGRSKTQAKSDVKSSISSYWRKKYIASLESGDTAELERIVNIMKQTGLYKKSTLNDITSKWKEEYKKSNKK